MVDVLSAILDGYNATAAATGYHRNGLATVATQREQKRVQLCVIRFNPLNDVLFAQLGSH